MADKNELAMEEAEEEEETNLGYTPPAPKSLKEIQEQDKDDESLLKYKQMLLGAPLGAVGVYAHHPVGGELEKCLITHTFLPVFDQTHTPQQTCSSQQQSLGSREGLYTIFGLDFILLRLYNLIYIETEGKK